MPSILGIDTASPRGSVALWVDGVARGNAELPPGGHSSGLAAAAARLAAGAEIALAQVTGIAVSQGPGSFTGLRIGLAWAKGVAFGAKIPILLVSAHEAAAHEAAALAAIAPDTLLLTVTPGERRQVEIALWEAGVPLGRPHGLREPESVPEEDLADVIETMTAGRSFLALPSNDAVAALLDEDEVPRRAPSLLAPSVAALGALLLEAGLAADLALAAPAYGRAPNARKPAS